MKFSIDVPFECDDKIRPFLQQVFDGEYDVREFFMHSPNIIDLGANCGAFSVWASHRWPFAEIWAYEPHPETFKTLEMNTKRYSNVKIHNWGIGTPGIRVLSDGLRNSGEASFHHVLENPTPTGRHLEVKDPLSLPEADIIKLDIEGCELEVLAPLINSGRKFSFILLEYHNHALRRVIDALLKDYLLIGAHVHSITGLGVMKYVHKDLMPKEFVE